MTCGKNIGRMSSEKKTRLLLQSTSTFHDQWVVFLDIVWSNQTHETFQLNPKLTLWNSNGYQGLQAFKDESHGAPVNLQYKGDSNVIKMFPGQLDISIEFSLVDALNNSIANGSNFMLCTIERISSQCVMTHE